MSDTNTISTSKIQQWIADKLDEQKIVAELSALGHDSDTIEAHLKEFNRVKYTKRQNSGLVYLVVGAVLGFVSCVLSILNPFPELFNWILYGITSIAVVLICAGLYYFLE